MTFASPTSPMTRIVRALQLRCPACGARGVVAHWLKLAQSCAACGLRMDRGEPDHFLGGYVINLGIAETVAATLWITLLTVTWPDPSWTLMEWSAAVLVIAVPIVMYPFTRLLFLALDLSAQPSRPGDFGAESSTYE